MYAAFGIIAQTGVRHECGDILSRVWRETASAGIAEFSRNYLKMLTLFRFYLSFCVASAKIALFCPKASEDHDV
jgi:hypothetical protein